MATLKHAGRTSTPFLLALIAATACSETPLAPGARPEAPRPQMSVSSGAIMIDDFNTSPGTFGGDWRGYKYQAAADVAGGGREHAWYNYGIISVNTANGTLEWKGTGTSRKHRIRYGTGIGQPSDLAGLQSPNGAFATQLNLNLTLQGEFLVEVTAVGNTPWVEVQLLPSSSGAYYAATHRVTAPGVYAFPISSFRMWGLATGAQLTEAAAADIDGIHVLAEHDAAITYGSFSVVPGVANVDADGDGANDDVDNCVDAANPDQADNDGDGQGDVCDSDDDNDGVADAADAFPLDASESADNDGDGTGDNADTDDDNDGQSDAAELACGSSSTDAGSRSADNDGDNSPDCVDTDDDNDGVADGSDAFPMSNTEPTVTIGSTNTGVANQALGNGSTFSDNVGACATSAKNHGQFTSCVTGLASQWAKAGLISNGERSALVTAAAQSSVGKK